ncbi:MAG: hypothetical protein AB8G96_04780 [Phycisphaerales bacterium]
MRSALHLAFRHALAHPIRTIVLATSMAAAIAVPLIASRVLGAYDQAMRARAVSTPMVVGPAASRFEVLFTALNFRAAELPPIPARLADELVNGAGPRSSRLDVIAVPLHVRAKVRGRPMVATSPEYFEFRGLRATTGELPLFMGDAVLGAVAARELGLGAGDSVYTDPFDAFSIAAPSSIELSITGVLAPTGSADDYAIFTGLPTAWIVEGLLHGHDDVDDMDRDHEVPVMAEDDERVVVDPSLIPDQRVDAEALDRYHAHGDLDDAPISAIILIPADEKAATIIRSRANATPAMQAIVPSTVFEELLGFAVRIKRVIDALALVLGACTVLLVGLVTGLTARARADEFRTLHHLGAPRRVGLTVIGAELFGTLLAAAAGAWGLAELAAAVAARVFASGAG